VANPLDGFVPFLLERSQYAKSHNIPRFKLHHANGDILYVTLRSDGKIEVLRRFPEIDGKPAALQMRLVTSESELERDIATGVSSYQAEYYRG
jgi:hypothetical protein